MSLTYWFIRVTLLCVVLAMGDELGPATSTNSLTPYVTVKTNIRCDSMRACLQQFASPGAAAAANSSWCQSGVACITGYCYLLPDYPCARATTVCHEATRTCTPKSCRVSSDCDDHLYCTGVEKCASGKCIIDGRQPPPCGPYGVCNELTHVCLQRWQDQTVVRRTLDALSLTLGQQQYRAANHTAPSNHNESNEENEWIVWVIVGVVIVLFFVLVFLMVAVGNRSWTPIPVNNAAWQYS